MQAEGTFANILRPVRVEEFFSKYWEQEPLHIRRGDGNYYADFLTTSALDEYFRAGNLSPYFLRVVKTGVDCPQDSWTCVEQRKNTDPFRVVVVEKLFSLFCEGATIIINAAENAVSGLTRLCTALEQELETRLQFNIYITPPGAQGFGFHYDTHDVFILQIGGSKRWRLYDGPTKLPVQFDETNLREYENSEPKSAMALTAGDLLYLPRGVVHCASATTVPSVHVTAALMSKCWFSLLEELSRVAQREEAFRRTLPHGFSTRQERDAFSEGFRQRLAELVAGMDVEALLERSRVDFIENQVIDRRTRFMNLLQVDRLSLDSLVSTRKNVSHHVEQGTKNLAVKFGRAEISVPRFMEATLELLLREEPYTARDLAGPVSDAGKLELVKRFVRAGLLKIDAV